MKTLEFFEDYRRYKRELVIPSVLAILIFNFSIVRSQPYMPIKPLSSFDMGSNERVVIGISSISSPYILNITKIDWAGWVNNVTTGMAIGGVGGALSNVGKLKAEDTTEDFRKAITKVLESTDLQHQFADIIKNEIKPETPATLVYLEGESYKNFAFETTDLIINVSLYFMFSGGKPVLTAKSGVSIIKKGTDLKQFEQIGDSVIRISDELQKMPPMKLLKSGKIDELKKESDKLMTFLSCLQQFTIKSEPYSIKEWLDNDGQLIKSELERVMRKFASDLNILLNVQHL
ncbi:MAG: hypothetical protein ABFC28_07555 [Rikenellaceae bacterium]